MDYSRRRILMPTGTRVYRPGRMDLRGRGASSRMEGSAIIMLLWRLPRRHKSCCACRWCVATARKVRAAAGESGPCDP